MEGAKVSFSVKEISGGPGQGRMFRAEDWDENGPHFDIGDPASAGYIGSGGVEGRVGDQFAMDEHDGYLRVATTTSRYSVDQTNPRSFRFELGSRLSVLAPQPDPGGGSNLALVGEIAHLVDGERLMATRFVGGRGSQRR